MADYREISQEYAQGGFKAVALLNGGAAVAILTQLSELKELAQPVLVASSFWAAGITLSALAWIAAFISDMSTNTNGSASLLISKHQTHGCTRAYWPCCCR